MIALRNVSYRYGTATDPSIVETNLEIPAGEFVLVTGPSGCGKTTMANMLNGLIPHLREGELRGEIHVAGLRTSTCTVGQLGRRIGTVFQDPRTQFFTLNTSEEIAFGCRYHGLGLSEIIEQTTRSFVESKIANLADRNIQHLSSGQLQLVAIAASRVLDPTVFLLDEPSANLDSEATAHLRQTLFQIKAKGHTVVILEHRLHYLAGLFDRVLYLNQGRIAHDYTSAQFNALSSHELASLGLRVLSLSDVRLRSERTSKISSSKTPGSPGTPDSASERFICEDVSFCHRASKRNPGTEGSCRGLKGLSLCAGDGEVVAIVGPSGAGKTSFARVCAGLETESNGRIYLNGQPMSPRDRLGKVYLVAQDSSYQLFANSVHAELHITDPDRSLLTDEKALLTRLGLWTLRNAHPASLSRGQQQRLTVATALTADARVLFFDEPSSGLDRHSMIAVAELLQDLALGGRVVFVISHDPELIAACCSRVVGIEKGRVVTDNPLTPVVLAALCSHVPANIPAPTTSTESAKLVLASIGSSTTRIDPRIRLLIAVMVVVTSFGLTSSIPTHILIALSAALLVIVRRSREAVCFVLGYSVVTIGVGLVGHIDSSALHLTLTMLAYLVQKLTAMAMMGVFLSADMSISLAVSTLEWLRAPRALTLPLTVALRFLPTIHHDWRSLRENLRVRGLSTDALWLLAHPLQTIDRLVVPILMRALQTADELTAAGLVRGLDNPGPTTSLNRLVCRHMDLYVTIIASIIIAIAVAIQLL